MTENKRFKLAYEKGNWWAVRDGEITLWKEEVVGLLNEQEEMIKRLKTIREEQTETILKQKRKIKELEKCREELFIRERDTKNECRELKERNQRQYNQLKEITDLMSKRDWEALESIVEDWEESDRLLQAEWDAYGGSND